MKVLIVETDPPMSEVVKVLLETRGISVTAVADFDVVLTNVRELAEAPGIKTLYMSASRHLVDQVRHQKVPAISKPFDLDELVELLKTQK